MSIRPMNYKTMVSYFSVVLVLTGATYWVCDYYLATMGKELVLSWAQAEAIAIQEGNFLTSITKAQRFLLSSDYFKGVTLVRNDNGSLKRRIEFGSQLEVNPLELSDLEAGITNRRVGFLHQRVYFKPSSENQFILVFDLASNFLKTVFLVFSSVLLLAVVYLIWVLQRVERAEAQHREDLIKLAVEDFLQFEAPSSILEKSAPGLLKWWTLKKSEIEAARGIAVANQDKIAFAELASITAHDIKSSLRNIREISKLVTGITETQKRILTSSIIKVSDIASNLLTQTQEIHKNEVATRINVDLSTIVFEAVNFKQNQYGAVVDIKVNIESECWSAPLNPQDLERTLHNLIDNAVEASPANTTITMNFEKAAQIASIQIVDSGKGISQEIIPRIGTKGFTYGKAGGTGLGLFYAKQFVEAIGGRLQLKSTIGHGTTVTLEIPIIENPVAVTLRVAKDECLVILDDSESIREAVRTRMFQQFQDQVNVEIFASANEFESWLANNKKGFKLVSDYFLQGDKTVGFGQTDSEVMETGLEVIERLGIADRSIIFTSAYDDYNIQAKAAALGVKVISKEQFDKLPITFEGRSPICS
jgi:signal transduction histidine kinase